jgi:hypothetical protein
MGYILLTAQNGHEPLLEGIQRGGGSWLKRVADHLKIRLRIIGVSSGFS